MIMISNTTPLVGIDAVVLDTETTGLDPARARLIEFGAVRLRAGILDADGGVRRLVNPGEAIPAAAFAVHGIGDAAVADAPPFSAAWAEISAYLQNGVLIGHSLGFDIAILKRECERAGLAWAQPRGLDIALLARVAAPNLANYGIDQIAPWLGVTLEGRHSALGDALTAARVFLALLPKLREKGIRTLAEAERASAGLAAILTDQHRAGWAEPTSLPPAPKDSEPPPRTDLYPYRHRTRDLMNAPVIVGSDLTLDQALGRMTRERISSLLVRPAEGSTTSARYDEMGIITERDVMRALSERGAAALALPIEPLVSKPVAAVPADAFAYRAIGRMSRLHIRHLAVTDEDGRICGVVSARDLLRLRARDAIWLGDEIEAADDVGMLSRAWEKLPVVAAQLRQEEISGREVAELISEELRALTKRAAGLAEQRMSQSGEGTPPCAYAVAVLGSGGRGESLLTMDQDNALVFASGEPDGTADRWFARFGGLLADILHEAGVPYCKGGVMARNAQWRGSLATWRDRVAAWIGKSAPSDLLSVDIFFDLRAVHGDLALASQLWREAFDQTAGEVAFAKLLADSAGTAAPALGLFGRLRSENGRIDVKKAGLFGIVSMARALAIRHHIVEHATAARLERLKGLNIGGGEELDDLIAAQAVFLDLLVDQQVDDMRHGLSPSNTVAVKRLSERQKKHLRNALGAVRHIDELTQTLLFRN